MLHYMEQPQPFRDYKKNEVCLLKKSLDGIRQSGREWNLTWHKLLKSEGTTRSKADPCVSKEKKHIVRVYIDDLLIIAEEQKEIADFKSRLGEEFGAKDLEEASHIHYIRLKREKDGKLTRNQMAYAEVTLETFGMADAKVTSSIHLFWILEASTKKAIDSDDRTREDLPHKYRQAIGVSIALPSRRNQTGLGVCHYS